ncbi:MAG: substrate-binding domain-containing protein [Bacteroidota bacterium]
MRRWAAVMVLLVPLAGCGGREPGSAQLTKGTLRLGCDEAVARVIQREADEFSRLYTEARVTLQRGEAREIIADFAADSLRVIVCARALNPEERNALQAAKVEFREYEVARTAVAVIAHPDIPVTRLRVGELDTIFAGGQTLWPGRELIRLAVAGVNSSVTEVFRARILGRGGYDPVARAIPSSDSLIAYVAATKGAIGIVGLDGLQGKESGVNVLALATPEVRPDSTRAPGEYYTPAQAYVYLGYYPVTAPVYIYTRMVDYSLADGFIAFVTSAPGQKVFQANGLVPMTMPVRLVQLTSQQVY